MGATGAVPVHNLDLSLSGMTCASCAARIEKSLNRLEGVSATVNFATEKAAVEYDPELVATDQLVAAVEALGYSAAVPEPWGSGREAPAVEGEPSELVALRQRLVVSTILTVPVVLMAMFTALQFTNWQWLSLTLAAPVAVWGAWPFHQAAWTNLRHGAATMDTLVSLGVLASFGWSLWALFFGDAGMPGMTMPFSFALVRGGGRRAPVPRGGGRGHRPHSDGPIPGGARQAAGRGGPAGTARARGEGRRPAGP